MRTALNPGNSLTNPAVAYFQWNGAVEKVKNTAGEIEKTGGFVFFNDPDNDYEKTKVDLPLTLYPLGESYSIAGGQYDPNGASTFLSSSEFGGWDEPLKVYEREQGNSNGALIAQGVWNDIKDTIKAHKGKLQTNLYALAMFKGEKAIVRLQLTGGASFALSTYRKKSGNEYFNRPLVIKGAEYKINGTVDYAVPVIEGGEAYDEAAIKGLEPYMAEINEYGNALLNRNQSMMEGRNTITDATSDLDYQKEVAKDNEALPTEAEVADDITPDMIPF